MKKQYWIGLVVVAALAFGVGQAVAQDGGEAKAAAQAGMPAWLSKSDHHAALAKSCGEFDVKTEFWMVPGGDPQVAPATAKREMIMNGFFVQETYTMEHAQGKFVGRGVLGYDVNKKKYCHCWLDNGISGMSFAYGEEKDGVLVFMGEAINRMTGQPYKAKNTLKIDGPDSWVFTEYAVTDKGETPMMRLTYTRKKK